MSYIENLRKRVTIRRLRGNQSVVEAAIDEEQDKQATLEASVANGTYNLTHEQLEQKRADLAEHLADLQQELASIVDQIAAARKA
jgi:septal ring factor EnvC (AmiA/AmiB activator)